MEQTMTTIAPVRSLISEREKQVLKLIAYEYSTREIATELFVSYDTALSHRKNLLRKMAVKNVAGLVRVAFEQGFLRAAI